MPVTIKCPDCGHTEESADGATKTCPECEGAMTAPPKKKYQAKSSSLEDEERAKKKDKRRDDDDDDDRPKKKPRPRADDDDEPKAKKEAMSLDDEEEEEKPRPKKKDKPKGSGGRDGAAAESLGISPGFKNKALMEQVEAELDDGETLHWAGRACPELVNKSGKMLRLVGFLFAGMGLFACLMIAAVAPGMAKLAAVVPLIFVVVGLLMAFVLPGKIENQAKRTWYAVTDDRAIVYTPSFFGSGGKVASYRPQDLRKMRVKHSNSVSGAGDLIFKTKIGVVHTKNGSRETEIHYGFLSVENVSEVETLIHKVLLGTIEDD
jgi:hypothetical protein